MSRFDYPAMLKLATGGLLAALGFSVVAAQLDACDRRTAEQQELEDLPPLVVNHTPVPQPKPVPPADLAMGAGMCDPVTGERGKYTKAQRRETYNRVRFTARQRLKMRPIMVAWMSVRTTTESSGRQGVRHTQGKGENGLGAHGLNLASHKGKWPGKADPDFCAPEVSTVVLAEVAWIAVTKYKARSIVEIQAVVGGRGKCDLVSAPGERRRYRCWAPSHYTEPRHIKQRDRLCRSMRRRGFSCWAHVSHLDLGRRLRKHERLDFARKAREAYDARNR